MLSEIQALAESNSALEERNLLLENGNRSLEAENTKLRGSEKNALLTHQIAYSAQLAEGWQAEAERQQNSADAAVAALKQASISPLS